MRFSTRAIHVGQEPDSATGATIPPIYQTSTFTQEGLHEHKGYEYARSSNPTRTALETCIASLENGKYGLAFASGMAAESAVLTVLQPGDHVLAPEDLYGGTYRLFEHVYRRYGIEFDYIDTTDPNVIAESVREDTRMLWLESPTNPLLKITGIREASTAAKGRNPGLVVVVDNTFASPALQNPLNLGADVVVHSTTKYLGGHSDVIGGAIVTSNEALYKQIKFFQNAAGPVPGPFDCWLVLRGIKTLSLRMVAHCENAGRIARWLSEHPRVERVHYPGLITHPNHEVAKQQMRGFGGMLSFEIDGGLEAAREFISRVRIFQYAESLGGVESLVGHPPSMSHASMPPDERARRGITDGLLRLSVGIEDVADLLEDLEQALRITGSDRLIK